jgi:cation:H+ antiporter
MESGVTAALLLLAGLVALVAGAELVVREGSALAARLGVHPIVVGMTVVALGTSLPELAIGITAAQQGNGGLAVGNIVGTNLVNILLILGVSALLQPVDFERRTLRFDLPVMSGAAVLLLILGADGSLSTFDGLWLCGYGCFYLGVLILTAVRKPPESLSGGGEQVPPPPPPPPPPERDSRRAVTRVAWLVVGLAVIVVGSELLVDGAVGVAQRLGMSDALIGLTIVAIGTSAPELVTTIVSTVRGNRSIALGNLLGSSVFNIALILGPTVLVAPAPVPVPDDILAVDLLLLVATALICVPLFWTKRRLSRIEGGVFVATYVGYLVWLVVARV